MLLLNFLICCMIIKLMIKNNVEKLLEKNSIYEKMFLMKLHPLRIRVQVVSLFPSGLGIVSKKVKLCYVVKLMLKGGEIGVKRLEVLLYFELTVSMK